MADESTNNGVTLMDFLNDGGVQALAFESKYGKITIGVVAPGRHDFGVVDVKRETIKVTSGTFAINETHLKVDDVFVIDRGDHIVFEAKDYATYICFKGKE